MIAQQKAVERDQDFERPKVIYLDRRTFFEQQANIEQSFQENGLKEKNLFTCAAVGDYAQNRIYVFVNCFDDADFDALYVSRILRHEIAHLSTPSKIRLYKTGPKSVQADGYRTGAVMTSAKRDHRMGEVVNEGHNDIEDKLYKGELSELRQNGTALNSIPSEEDYFPGVAKKFEQLHQSLIERKLVPKQSMLTDYYRVGQAENYGFADTFDASANLMTYIYKSYPELVLCFEDFIYQGKIINAAREFERRFGKGRFTELMNLETEEDAERFLEELKTQSQIKEVIEE